MALDHEVEDISLGGARLTVDHPQEVGAPVLLVLTYCEDEAPPSVTVHGEVAWCSESAPYTIGIHFTNVGESIIGPLTRFIEECGGEQVD